MSKKLNTFACLISDRIAELIRCTCDDASKNRCDFIHDARSFKRFGNLHYLQDMAEIILAFTVLPILITIAFTVAVIASVIDTLSEQADYT